LRLEKMITGFMLLMIVAIGAFNIVSTLAMNVAERTPDVAILRTMGASRFDLLLIFLLLGLMGAFIGITFGTIAGIIVSLNFATIGGGLQTLLNPQGLYVIGELPAVLQFDDVVLAVVSSLIVSILAALYPAWRASGILPAEVLRYE
jgi:lipoprotein-releasing system permease protein